MPLAYSLTPASVSTIEPDPVDPSSGPAELLSASVGMVPGAYGGPGSLQSLSLRGSGSTDVLYMVDGVPMNSDRDGGFDLNRLPSGITRVEVLRGPGSGLYGPDAAAGVVNFITRQPERGKPFSRVRYQQGSSDSRQLEALLSRGLGERAHLQLSGSWNKDGGQRPNSDYDGVRYSFELGLDPHPAVPVFLRHRHYGSRNGNPGPLSSPTLYERQEDGQDDYEAGVRFGGSASLILSQSSSYRTLNSTWGITESRTRVRQAELSGDRRLLPWMTASAGLAHRETDDRGTGSGNALLDRSSAFIGQQFELPYSLLAAVNLRYDRAAAYPSQLSPNLGLSWNPWKPFSVHASYGRAYKAPTLVDLRWPVEIYPPYFGYVYKISGNPRLGPESSRQLEAGARWASSRLSASLSLFQRRTKDLIDWTHIEFVPPDTTYNYPANIGRAVAAGAEASAALTLWGFLTLEASYSHCRSAEDSSGGRVLPYRPLNSASGSLRLNDLKLVGALRLGWKLSAEYADRQVVAHASEWSPGLELPRRIVAGQTFSVVIRDARLYYATDNLFNVEYQTRYGYPMPRRTHSFGLVIELWD